VWVPRHARLFQVLTAVTVVANPTNGGIFEVALPALAHLRSGAAYYGAIVACFGGGAVTGTPPGKAGRMRHPAPWPACAFLVSAAAICPVPFLGGLPRGGSHPRAWRCHRFRQYRHDHPAAAGRRRRSSAGS
jgi:hypothetical protein